MLHQNCPGTYKMAQTPTKKIKPDAHQLVDALPDEASWDDLIESIYVRQCVEAGLEDLREGRVVDHATVWAQFGLKP